MKRAESEQRMEGEVNEHMGKGNQKEGTKTTRYHNKNNPEQTI
jgi:hypothetical protein